MKRGSSGLSLVIAVNKPSGVTSHDMVNATRRIFGERRVGHTGTLDPLATGVLPLCIGPATRLDRYMTGHDKRYRVTMRFGFETTTDDCQGEPTRFGNVPTEMVYGSFAESYVAGLVGKHDQVPPAYSAVKVAGDKAYELARRGKNVKLEPRTIEVYDSKLIDRMTEDGSTFWIVDFSVSKGTYIRALVRDMGRELGCYAHVTALERRVAGTLSLDDCVSLESLESLKEQAALDPVRLLGFRFVFADESRKIVESGGRLRGDDMRLFDLDPLSGSVGLCPCTASIRESVDPMREGELVSVVIDNKLKAVYRYEQGCLKPDCVFSTPIIRA